MPKPDYRVIFSRLGYRQKETELAESSRKEIVAWIDETASLVNLKGVMLESNFEVADQDKILIYPAASQAAPSEKIEIKGITCKARAKRPQGRALRDPLFPHSLGHERASTSRHSLHSEIISSSLCKFISGANKILLMGITCGKEIADFIEKEQKENMTKAVVLDAAAGEIADRGLDYIMSLYSKELIRKSEKLFSKRFSPGYGDLSLETQKIFYNLLEMKKIEVNITESFLLIPQKSVIALTGIV
ncbi:MAG: hypothetical protein FWC36_10125 [Spirochaetes bacterium]|nr:hypothetical protein [Spirochaetota bacterium]